MKSVDIVIDEVCKIEGKCGLEVHVRDGEVTSVRFSITEYKRFYTNALKHKDIIGLPQLACRICGTCSNAHLLCAIQAVENALGMSVSAQTKVLRELVNYGLMIRDHALHLYLFVLPDLLGVDSLLSLDETNEENKQILEDAFALKAAGNALSMEMGGRSVHAPYPMVGGFTKLPDPTHFQDLIHRLQIVREAAIRLINRFAACPWKLDLEVSFAALIDDRYSFLSGMVKDSEGSDSSSNVYKEHLQRVHLDHSHATGYRYKQGLFMVGAIARLNLGKDYLHENTKKDCEEILKRFPSKNLYDNNLAQAIEILHAIDRSLELLSTLTIVPEKPLPVLRKEGVGIGLIEAPRGTLLYKIAVNEKGSMSDVEIVVPTGQNQIGIEEALRIYFTQNLDKPDEELRRMAEVIVRAYDPCMSCASHFLSLKLVREEGSLS